MKFWYTSRTVNVLSSLSPRTIWAPMPITHLWCRRRTALWASLLTLRLVDLCSSGHVFHQKLKQKPYYVIGEGFGRGHEVHAAFPILCEYFEENTRLLKISGKEIWAIKQEKKKKKKDTEKILAVGTSCHPYISSNIILNSTTLSLEKATV